MTRVTCPQILAELSDIKVARPSAPTLPAFSFTRIRSKCIPLGSWEALTIEGGEALTTEANPNCEKVKYHPCIRKALDAAVSYGFSASR